MVRTVYRRKGKPHPGYLPYQAQPTHFPNFHIRLPYPPTLLRVRRLGEWYPQQVSSQPYPGHLHILILPYFTWENTLPYLVYLINLPQPHHLNLHTFTHHTLPLLQTLLRVDYMAKLGRNYPGGKDSGSKKKTLGPKRPVTDPELINQL